MPFYIRELQVKLMKKSTLILGLFFGLFFVVFPVMGAPVLNTNISSKSLNYGSGYFAILIVEDLELETEYILMVANNTADAYNITFTPTVSRAEIHVDYKGTLQDIYNNSLTELQVILVEGATIHWTHYIELNYDNTLASLVQWIIDLLIFCLWFFLGGLVVIFISKKF